MVSYKKLSLPPCKRDSVLTSEQLISVFSNLVGMQFQLSGKVKSDGSRFRKMVSDILLQQNLQFANEADFSYVPYKKKGIPRLLCQMLDTYLVTSGDSYNLQIWNRMPNSDDVLVRYNNNDTITCKDIRILLAKINIETEIIESIIITTPSYIEEHYGSFGKPTVKSQLIISSAKRTQIIANDAIIESRDTPVVEKMVDPTMNCSTESLYEFPEKCVLPIQTIKALVSEKLIGYTIKSMDTKRCGQELERLVASLLGYSTDDRLVGGYPDIPNQLLEVKVQESPTVDLGLYSPANKRPVENYPNITSEDMRYLIALTNPQSHTIEGIIITCGLILKENFSIVAGESYKCQRSIPMSLFASNVGKCIALI